MPRELNMDVVKTLLQPRRPESHKGSFGKVLCLVGSSTYRGAAALCVEGALRAGAGIVQLASVEPVLGAVLPRLPECTLLPCPTAPDGSISADALPLLSEALADADAFVAGPGLGRSSSIRQLLEVLIPLARCPVILDADALYLPDKQETLPHPQQGKPLILTPHPGEMARMCGLSAAEVNASRESVAAGFARAQNCIVVLKGHRTLIAAADGIVWKNTTGNAGLARGGSGDILAGMIGAFAAQGLGGVAAAQAGVWLHGAAADLCASRKSQLSMLPHDIFDDLGCLLAQMGL